jgi:hypothetical protein
MGARSPKTVKQCYPEPKAKDLDVARCSGREAGFFGFASRMTIFKGGR